MYKIVTSDQDGYVATHRDEITSLEEAREETLELIKLYEGYDFWVEQSEYEYKEEKQYNYNAVDGWEDLYPLEE